jgi:hypothetical protein
VVAFGHVELLFGGIKEQYQDWFDNIGCFMGTVIWAAGARLSVEGIVDDSL